MKIAAITFKTPAQEKAEREQEEKKAANAERLAAWRAKQAAGGKLPAPTTTNDDNDNDSNSSNDNSSSNDGNKLQTAR